MCELSKTLLKETEQLVNMHYEDDSVKTIILRNLRDIRKHMSGKDTGVPTNDGWIPVEERLPEDGADVLVVLKPTYESDYIEYSVARYLRFENDEAHWCDNHYGYLEWEKYSDGYGGSSWYRVVAWQKINSYRPERSDK